MAKGSGGGGRESWSLSGRRATLNLPGGRGRDYVSGFRSAADFLQTAGNNARSRARALSMIDSYRRGMRGTAGIAGRSPARMIRGYEAGVRAAVRQAGG